MPGNLLNTSSIIICPHGGQAVIFTSNTRVSAQGSPVLLESDVHPVAGCPFTVGPKYSPCIRIEWAAGTARSAAGGTPELNRASVGTCYNAEGAPQGVAIIVNTQIKASGQ
ncbi:MAG: hypothetical protein GY737_17980 [Desulfobacteraceae bacterium]|nr:hypothetical protein [Desulfobacteraceae bacterium]